MADVRGGHGGAITNRDKGGRGRARIVEHTMVGGHVCGGSGVHDPLTNSRGRGGVVQGGDEGGHVPC
jgi:hypothetical protein